MDNLTLNAQQKGFLEFGLFDIHETKFRSLVQKISQNDVWRLTSYVLHYELLDL